MGWSRLGMRSVSILGAGTVATMLSMAVATAPASAQSMVERGKYLVDGIGGCGNCHTPRGGPAKGKFLAGGFKFGGGPAPFESYSSNITPDAETGIGNWTDEQLIVSIREGKRPDGSVVGIPMPIEFYSHMSDNDAKAIVAYMRTVTPVKNKVKKSMYKMPLRAGHAVSGVADVAPSNRLKYGEYLVKVGHCMECHSPQIRGRIDHVNQMGAGGRSFKGPWGESIAANITPDKATGLGSWTDAQIKRAITEGVRHDGSKLRPPMCFDCYSKMTDSDVDAMIAFLRTIKPMKNKVR